ncbi:molecular chaperone [Dissulfurispira thermophila]|uniref:Molecular chaperone n=2 Tax=root TaxID=1 RepID=A0A7G1H3J9_9BACT|nr:Hsp20/alpha crystallin family protein [Dissulfurispira thermophila]BCB96712.1 molecular chaperone [Dissulfurispira thermophila]
MEKWDPFSLRERINKLFEASQTNRGITDSSTWMPALDIYETPEEFVVKAELPEVTESDINIIVEGNILRISGERRFSCEGRSYYQAERPYGAFFRSFHLPFDVDKDNIRAVLNDGILKIILPKNVKDLPKHIEIK